MGDRGVRAPNGKKAWLVGISRSRWRRSKSDSLEPIADTGPDSTRYVDRGLMEATTYHYRIVAHKDGGHSSDPSKAVAATALLLPTDSDTDNGQTEDQDSDTDGSCSGDDHTPPQP